MSKIGRNCLGQTMNHDVNQEDDDLNNPQRLQFKAQEMGLKMCQNIYEKKKI